MTMELCMIFRISMVNG